MSIDKNELIAKLEKISELYSETVEIATEIEDFIPEDNYKRKHTKPIFIVFPDEGFEDVIDHESDYAEEVVAMGIENVMAPKEPVKPTIEEFKEPAKPFTQNMGCLSWIGIAGVAFFMIGGILNVSVFTMPLFYVIIAVFLGIFVFAKFKIKQEESRTKKKNEEALKNYNKNKDDILAKYDSDLKAYKENYNTFTAEKEKIMKEYKEWRKKYLAYLSEEAEIEEKLEADRMTAVNRIYEEKFTPAKTKLDECNDLLTEEYLPSIDVIISLLKSGRADDLKEAINLYEEIVYKERQLQLEREKEEQRRFEEEQRRKDEERRHNEEMSFKKEQEYQRRREETQRRNDEERRFKAEQQARENERQAAINERRAAESKAKSNCHWCQNFRNCGKRNNPPMYCPAFRPGSTHQI